VNAQVTGTKTYSMRIARAPSANEGMTALHVAAQAGRVDLVRYLLEKGANTQIADAGGRKAIDLVGAGARAGAAATAPVGSVNSGTPAEAPASPAGSGAAGAAPAAAAGNSPGGRGGAGNGAANAAEIRALLENAASKK
jgi:hypothetical protein